MIQRKEPGVPIEPLPALETGLTSQEARRRLAHAGQNEPARAHATAGFLQFLRLFASPLTVILLIASTVSAVLGERLNAAIIVTIVLFSVTLDFLQAYRSQRAVERLREGVAPCATATG
jgi:Mg2+-importing ATPase